MKEFKLWINFLKRLIFGEKSFKHGSVLLGYGRHELDVKISKKIHPLKIYLNCKDDGLPICCGNISLASAILKHNKFTIYADVQSESCLVEWLLECR